MKFHLIPAALVICGYSFAQGFTKVDPKRSGITFTNAITETDMINGMTYEYLYNGAGVSIGDFNNDGWEDIFFTSNQEQNRLYLNKGSLGFVDATKKYFGKTQPEGFNTGSTVADVNNDGYLDIYVSRAGWYDDHDMRRNLLYINVDGKKFVEKAAEYGIADSSCTTQSVFFDADLDGDLDLYLLNHMRWLKRIQSVRQDQPEFKVMGEDVYYENVGGKYVVATKKAGLYEDASFGLGIVVSDLNGDSYPDIYITNDYEAPDRFYMNNGDGTFTDILKEATNHISYYAMGVDIADINNDLLPDIFSVDMASEDHVRSKKNMAGMSTKDFWYFVKVGNHYQYMFNSLQLNMGHMKFAEIAQLSGVSKTDWSWAALVADFDNDGFGDLFVTNGYKRDVRDNDYRAWVEQNVRNASTRFEFAEIISKAPQVKVPNYIFKNNGDLTFSNKVLEWGVSEPVNANGAAYADLDKDGDLDLVVSALDDMSFIMENKTETSNQGHNWLAMELRGMPGNDRCIGAKVILRYQEQAQVREVQFTRGFQSSVPGILHFGTGNVEKIDEVVVEWNKKEITKFTGVQTGQVLKVDYKTAVKTDRGLVGRANTIFTEIKVKGLEYLHEELNTDDFQKEILLPNKMSELGPFITAGDLNGDQRADLFVGGSRGYPGEVFFQDENGSFEKSVQPALKKDGNHEDMGSVIFDADNDGDNDLYVVSGSNECPENHPILQDRLYLNDGKGNLSRAADALPMMYESGQKVLAKDLNNDGWTDIISFGRQVPENYPKTPKTFVLLNEKGKFVDATAAIAPDLSRIGMVTDAIFSDFDGDGDDDLLIVGEWMPVTIFENTDGKWTNETKKFGLEQSVGWWSSIAEYPSGGKDKKYILGNIGANNKFHPSVNKPLQVYMNDFDANGTNDIVLAKYQGSICYPVRGRQCSSEQMPFIKEKFPSYSDFAVASLEHIYTTEKLAQSVHFNATHFESAVLTFSNIKFGLENLPNQCQFSAVNAILVNDFNNDGLPDVLLLGNKFEAEVETIRYDAGFGVLMIGQKTGGFKLVSNIESGLYLDADIKSAVLVKIGDQEHIVMLPKREHFRTLDF
jgi:enediyne biosynthesis protein E4